MGYDQVNKAWPDPLPVPTEQEAIAGARRLIRLMVSEAEREGVSHNYRFTSKRFVATSGRRYTWLRSNVWRINPNGPHFGGWKDIAHCISHWAQHRFWPTEKPHGIRHVWLERMCVDYIITNFLDGQLKRPERAEPDVKAVRAARVAARIKTWQTKQKRAETALRKLRRQARYYGVETTC